MGAGRLACEASASFLFGLYEAIEGSRVRIWFRGCYPHADGVQPHPILDQGRVQKKKHTHHILTQAKSLSHLIASTRCTCRLAMEY